MPVEAAVPFERAVRIADEIAAIAERDLFLVRTVADLKRCLAGEEVGGILHFEGAEPIEPGLGNLEAWYGARAAVDRDLSGAGRMRSVTACRSAFRARRIPARD